MAGEEHSRLLPRIQLWLTELKGIVGKPALQNRPLAPGKKQPAVGKLHCHCNPDVCWLMVPTKTTTGAADEAAKALTQVQRTREAAWQQQQQANRRAVLERTGTTQVQHYRCEFPV